MLEVSKIGTRSPIRYKWSRSVTVLVTTGFRCISFHSQIAIQKARQSVLKAVNSLSTQNICKLVPKKSIDRIPRFIYKL